MNTLRFYCSRALCLALAATVLFSLAVPGASWAAHTPGTAYLQDRAALDRLQRDAFRLAWEDAHPVSGMVFESSEVWGPMRPVAVGGTGFGIAAIVVAVDRGWISREQGLTRVLSIARFLRDKAPLRQLHGALPHWLDGDTGAAVSFSKNDTGADIVETALLMQGMLIARAYFNGPGNEGALRDVITELWEGVDWNWFTNGEDSGLYWHWTPEGGFSNGLKILGYNECLIAYVLAISSPTHPISRKAYDYWTSGKGYQSKNLSGYTVEASLASGGPLFLTHYSFIGLDPRKMADEFVPGGYFARNVKHTLSNRAYCLQQAPAKNKYSEELWGLTASLIKGGYAANEPARDSGTVAPTAAISSMPYTPQYSMQVLLNLLGPLHEKVWGKNGPYDAISPRDNWVSEHYLAIDQLPMVSMVENYRSGLLWRLFMSDAGVAAGLAAAGITEPHLEQGFPEAIVTLQRKGKGYAPDVYAMRRHPDTGEYHLPYWVKEVGDVHFSFRDGKEQEVFAVTATAQPGRNLLAFPQFTQEEDAPLTVQMKAGSKEYTLPVRLY